MLADPSTDVDADRRAAIADGLLRVVARGGLAAVSMRVVATEAGCSLGLVQRQVGTKDELLALGMARVIERMDLRIEAAGLDASLPARDFLNGLVEVLLADGHQEEGLVWAAFSAQALVVPSLTRVLRRQEEEGHAVVALVLRAGVAGGDLAGDIDPDREALALLSLINGLAAQMLLGRSTGAQARSAVRSHLDRLFAAPAEEADHGV